MNNFIYQGVGSLETGLLSTPPERLGFKATKPENGADPDNQYPEAKQEIEEGLHKLETLLNSTVDKNFDKFEIYVLRNILSVPTDLTQWIRLSHYEGLTYPPPTNAPSSEDIQVLRQKLAASRNVSRSLASEYNRNEAILSQLRTMTGLESEDQSLPNFGFLENTVPQQSFSGYHPLTTNTKFALSQLPALKATLVELRAKLVDLEKVRLSVDSAKDEMREERRQYIETRTREHLDRNGQTAGADAGPISGKQTNIAEVEALERAAHIFNPP